jgi:YggT family protein
VGVICTLLWLFIIAVFARVALSWFSPQPGGAMGAIEGFLRTVTDPVLEPVRRVVPRLGMVDLSPLVVLIGVQILQNAICT